MAVSFWGERSDSSKGTSPSKQMLKNVDNLNMSLKIQQGSVSHLHPAASTLRLR